MSKKKLLIVFVVALGALLVYGLIPLESPRFSIRQDKHLLEGKKKYLSSKPDEIADSAKVNVVWIVVDDLSIADTDLYTDGPVTVPNMNRLADQGVRFNNAYVSSPVCSPSRAAIMTGRYNQRFGFEHQMHERYLRNRLEYVGFRYLINSGPWEPQYQTEVPNFSTLRQMGLPKSEITLAEILKKSDYQTSYIGKWHLGKKKDKSPTAFGFDHFYGFYSSHSLYSPMETPGIVDKKIPEDFTDKYIWEGQRDDLQAIRVNDKKVKEERYLTRAITDESIDFLREHKDSPFFLLAAYNAPHTPLQAPQEYVDMFANESDPIKRIHYAMIKCLDDEIGRLLDYLDENNLADNTLVMLISDNGGAEYNFTTSNGAYQGGKITNFEGGVKVPMLLRYPKAVSGGQTFDYPVHATDLFMTSLGLMDIQPPQDRIYDGANLIDHIQNNTVPHGNIFFEMGKNRGLRNLEWKLTWNEDNGDSILYNLKTDPFEQENLFRQHPDVVSSLVKEFNLWSDMNVDPLWPSMINYHYLADDGKDYYFDE